MPEQVVAVPTRTEFLASARRMLAEAREMLEVASATGSADEIPPLQDLVRQAERLVVRAGGSYDE